MAIQWRKKSPKWARVGKLDARRPFSSVFVRGEMLPMNRSLRWSLSALAAAFCSFAAPTEALAIDPPAEPIFRETWESGTNAWQTTTASCAVNGLGTPLATVTDPAVCTNKFMRESTAYTCGRFFTKSLYTVVPGKSYCMGALVRVNGATGGDRAYLAVHFATSPVIPQASGVGEHWLIGGNGTYPTGYGDFTTPVPNDGAWHWVTKSFTPAVGETTLVLKGEDAQGSALNTSDFDEITLVEGTCPSAPIGLGGVACTNGCNPSTNLCAPCTSDLGGAGVSCPTTARPFCIASGEGAGTCGQKNGAACASDRECGNLHCASADGMCGEVNGVACTTDATCRGGKCGADGKCGVGNGIPCTDNAQCRSEICWSAGGVCVAHCEKDEECATGYFCDINTLSCLPSAPNGSKIGGSLGISCDRGSQCLSGACGADGVCGARAGSICTQVGACRAPNGCFNGNCESSCLTNDAAGDSRCSPGGWCDASVCQLDVENGLKPGGVSCVRGAQCKSGICNGDGSCGSPNGTACKLPSECRSFACGGGVCKAACASNDECPSDRHCDSTTHACVADFDNTSSSGTGTCTTDAQCKSGICADGGCGAKFGGSCGPGPIVCRALVCEANDNGCGYVNGNGPCASADVCRSGACETDGYCGLLNTSPCTSDAQCRSNKCDSKSNACVPCEADGECGSAMYCDAAGTKDAACKALKANGQTCKAANECEVNVCTNGICGAADGSVCVADRECQTGVCSAGVCGAKKPIVDSGVADSGVAPAADSGVSDFAGESLNGGGCSCSEAPGTGSSFGLAGVFALVAAYALRRKR